jgi:hypothetical protein
MQEKKLPSG